MQRLKLWLTRHSLLFERLGLAALALFLLGVDSLQGWPVEQISLFYQGLSPALLANAFGVTAQIIGFVITLLATGIFVAGQFLGDRLPQSIIRPRLWGRTGVVPLRLLSALLAYVMVLFYLTGHELFGEELTPVASLVLVLTGVIVTGRICLIALTESIRALNVESIVSALGNEALQSYQKRDVTVLASVLRQIRSVAMFAVEHSNHTIVRRAMRDLFRLAQAWEHKAATVMEVSAQESSNTKEYTECTDILFQLPRLVLIRSIHKHDLVTFRFVLMELTKTMPRLSGDIQAAYRECLDFLVSYYPATSDPEVAQVLISAAATLAEHGLENKDESLVESGHKILGVLWPSYALSDNSMSAAILTAAGQTAHLAVKGGIKEVGEKSMVLYRKLGESIIALHSDGLFRLWLDGYRMLLRSAIEVKVFDALKLGDLSRRIYDLAIYHEFESGYRLLPPTLQSCLAELPQDQYVEVALSFESALLVSKNTSNDVALFPLVNLFVEACPRAMETSSGGFAKCLHVLSLVPLSPSRAANNLLAFVKETTSGVVEKGDQESAGAVFDFLLRLIARNHDAQGSTLSFLLGQVNVLLTSGKLSAGQHVRFIQFCFSTEIEIDSAARQIMFTYLREFIKRVKDPDVLREARVGCTRIVISAIEERDEDLVRAVSNYLGWLAYGVIVAEMRLPERVALLSDIMDITVVINRYARMCDLSSSTIIFLSSLYAVIGAVCEEQDDTERTELLKPVVRAVRSVNDLATLQAAIFAREAFGITIVSNGAESYARFLQDVS